MSNVRVEVDISGFVGDLKRLGDAIAGRGINSAAMAGGLVVEGAGKANIISYDFIDTGATLNSVEATPAGEGEVNVGQGTEYAIFGELGIGQSEKPFMREALEQSRSEISEAIAAELRDIIQGAIK